MRLELKKGIDILSDLGAVKTVVEAKAIFSETCDPESLKKIASISNEEALLKMANAVAMLKPDRVWVNSGSPEDDEYIRKMALKQGEEFKLALPGHTCHFDLPEDQGRMVDKTYYIANEGEDVSVLAKKMHRSEAHQYIKTTMAGMMKGKTMQISLWNRGPVGAKAAIPAIMITDSYYVTHSGNILYPTVFHHFDAEVKRAGLFFFNTHAAGNFKSEEIDKARIFMDRSWFTTFSMYCTYAGNTLMLKKGNHRFAVDLCTYYRQEEQLSEHMFITGLTGPQNRKSFFAGAAPSGCGKTTTAMVGTDFIGDDLAQIWIEKDGTMRAVNPEIGVFGIVEDVNAEGDPILMKCLRGEKPTEVIWSNVLIDEQRVPHWTGHKEAIPAKGKNWLGDWFPGKLDATGKAIPMSNANARFTMSSMAIDNYNPKLAYAPEGVPIKVITYSGRDSDTMPPVWVAKNPDHGVAIGASILSAATATEVGAKGFNRQPWANAPFTPGPLADYMDAQFKFFNSAKLTQKPIMAGLNYFLTHGARGGQAGDKKLLGEKRDVKSWLTWLERRAHGEVQAIDTPIGYIPMYADLHRFFAETIGKEYPVDLYNEQFSFYIDHIINRIDLQKEAYSKEKDCPKRIFEIYDEQKRGLEQLKVRFGKIITPDQLISAGGIN